MSPQRPALDWTRSRATQPGETRFWCGTCDPKRESPFLSAHELVAHVMAERRSGSGKHAAVPR